MVLTGPALKFIIYEVDRAEDIYGKAVLQLGGHIIKDEPEVIGYLSGERHLLSWELGDWQEVSDSV